MVLRVAALPGVKDGRTFMTLVDGAGDHIVAWVTREVQESAAKLLKQGSPIRVTEYVRSWADSSYDLMLLRFELLGAE